MHNNSREITAKKKGVSLIEVMVTIIVMMILSAVIIPRATQIALNVHLTATQKEMVQLRRAILGDPQKGYLGFKGNMETTQNFRGRAGIPNNINELWDFTALPAPSQIVYNNYTEIGWHGPYIEMHAVDADGDGTVGGTEYDLLFDAWGRAYTIQNDGGGAGYYLRSNGPLPAANDGDEIDLYLEY